jgi:hypothetical protein
MGPWTVEVACNCNWIIIVPYTAFSFSTKRDSLRLHIATAANITVTTDMATNTIARTNTNTVTNTDTSKGKVVPVLN